MVKGIIRREYISEKQRDLSEIETSFGIGDTVLARIVGIGDGDFIMATAEDNLGVAQSISKAGKLIILNHGFDAFHCFKRCIYLQDILWFRLDGLKWNARIQKKFNRRKLQKLFRIGISSIGESGMKNSGAKKDLTHSPNI